VLECDIATCKLGPGETVWKTPSLPAFAADAVLNSHVEVVLECDIATCKLGPGETIWMTPSMEHAAAESPFAGQHASEQASRRIVKSPLSWEQARKPRRRRGSLTSRSTCASGASSWGTGPLTRSFPSLRKRTKKANEWALAMNYCKFIMIFIFCV
jgi:hypothetical protein